MAAPASLRHVVDHPMTLGEALRLLLPDSSGRVRKQALEAGRVRRNGAVARRADTPLAAGDVVELGPRQARLPPLPPGLRLVHADPDLLVADKAAGLLTIATSKERERTAYAYLSSWVKLEAPSAKVFIVHRLDRDASGLLVLARSLPVKQLLQDRLRARSVERVYLALVEGEPAGSEGAIEAPLREASTGRVHVARAEGGRPARTLWRKLQVRGAHTLLEVRLDTGRKHQIRVHLAHLGHPIAGDATYGAGTDPLGRLALHATRLGFEHPRTGERLCFESKPPRGLGLSDPGSPRSRV